jgi:ribosomal protein S6
MSLRKEKAMESKNMKYYELAFILSSKLSETDASDIKQKLETLIQEKEGILDFSEDLKKISLSYPIEKETQAYLGSIKFFLKKDNIKEIEAKTKEEKSILRFILCNKKKIEAQESDKKRTAPKKKKKAELKDIEEKLDEILS